MIKSLDELPDTCIGDIVEIDGKLYAITGILSIFKEETEDTEPSISYKILIERIIGEMDN